MLIGYDKEQVFTAFLSRVEAEVYDVPDGDYKAVVDRIRGMVEYVKEVLT